MRVRVLGLIRRWETLLVVLLIGFVVLGSSLSPYFLSASNFPVNARRSDALNADVNPT